MEVSNIAEGVGHPPRRCGEGKLELTEALRSLPVADKQRGHRTAAERIPENFRSAEPGRVTPKGTEANASMPSVYSRGSGDKVRQLGVRLPASVAR